MQECSGESAMRIQYHNADKTFFKPVRSIVRRRYKITGTVLDPPQSNTPNLHHKPTLQTKTTWNHNGLHTQQFECFCWHVSQWPFELSMCIAFFIRRVLIDSPSTSQGDIWHRQHGARSFFVWPDEVLLQETPGRNLAAMRKSYLYHP